MVNRKLLSSKSKGFTLIELMLSTSLLMMVMFSGYYAYSLYSQKWQKRVDVFWQGTNQSVSLDALNKLFISTASYVIKNSEGKEGIYFSGDSTHLKFISNSPIFSSGSALIELVVQRIDNKEKLIYRENNLLKAPIYSLKDIESITEWQKEVVLFDNFNAISWSFYGWTSFADALEQAELAENIKKRELRKAYSLHNFGNIRVLPVSIKLSLNNGSNQSLFSIDLPNNTIFTLIANLRNDA